MFSPYFRVIADSVCLTSSSSVRLAQLILVTVASWTKRGFVNDSSLSLSLLEIEIL